MFTVLHNVCKTDFFAAIINQSFDAYEFTCPTVVAVQITWEKTEEITSAMS